MPRPGHSATSRGMGSVIGLGIILVGVRLVDSRHCLFAGRPLTRAQGNKRATRPQLGSYGFVL